MTEATTSRHPFLAAFTGSAGGTVAGGPPWLERWRRAALARFETLGFPTRADEEWKNTSVAPIVEGTFAPPARGAAASRAEALAAAGGPDLGGPRLVFVDGRLVAGPSPADGADLHGLWAGSLAQALATMPERLEPHFLRHDPRELSAFAALNAGLHEDGALVLIADGCALERPLEILHVSTGGGGGESVPYATFPRTLIVTGRNSRSRIVETFCAASAGVYLSIPFTDVVVGEQAELEHYRLQLEGPEALHVGELRTRQGRDSRYTAHTVHLGARLARHAVGSVLDGPGANCRLNGLYLTHGRQHVDNHTLLDHAAPHGASRELYKGILTGASRAVFNGKIVVRPGAQKTDAKQSNLNLLLSRRALAYTRPQLEISANDVKCTHGATVGRLDGEAVFYLQSRGLAPDDARRLLIEAFAGEVLDLIGIEALRDHLARQVSLRLSVERE